MRVTNPPLTEKQKLCNRRINGIRVRFALDAPKPAIKKVRDYRANDKGEQRADFRPCKLRGRSGTRLSQTSRDAMVQHASDRAAFFAALEG